MNIFIISQGCRLNQAETSLLEQEFLNHKFFLVKNILSAHIIVINTCTVTKKADNDTHYLINKINRENPKSKIAIIGCLAQIKKTELLLLPQVFWVIGNQEKLSLPKIILQSQNNEKIIKSDPISPDSFTHTPALSSQDRTRANLKIQDGCNEYCSYCIVPYTRGSARSRKFANIAADAKALISTGHKELVLTGINIGKYNYETKTLENVIEDLLKLNGLARIRISSIEPQSVTPKLINLMQNNPQICRFLHIPLQSGSSAVLKQMNRKYDAKQFSALIQNLHKKIPGICLGTDIMVGFPTETEADFQESVSLFSSLPLSYAHVFSYSDRTLPKSSLLPNRVTKTDLIKRSKTLRALSLQKHLTFAQTLLGTTQNVLFENQKNSLWTGYTDNYQKVYVKSKLNLENTLIPVKITTIQTDKLSGEILYEPTVVRP